jgi:ATP-dependent protease ClpP protease subunit
MPPKTARPRAQLRQGRNDWYRIENLAGGTAAVYIYDEIGYWGVSASDFVAELSEMQGVTAIDLHLNSPGGEVFDGLAIMNCLRSHPASVTTYVDGLAASIASVIAMAGDRIVMGPHSQLMIHEGSGLCIGDAAEMRKMADLLDFQSDNIAGVYQARAGGTVEEWRALMVTETWYTAEEAVAAGLADEVSQRPTTVPAQAAVPAGAPMDNTWDLSVFRYAGRDQAPEPKPVAKAAAAPKPAPPSQTPTPVTGQPTLTADVRSLIGEEAAAQLAAAVVPPIEEKPPAEPDADAAPAAQAPALADEPATEPVNEWAAAVARLARPQPDPWAAAVARLTRNTTSASSAATEAA